MGVPNTITTGLGVLEPVVDNSQQALQQAENFVQRGIMGGTSLPEEALAAIREGNRTALAQGAGVQRDQAYTGSNAGNVGYYLEPGLKFIIPLLTPFSNRHPRVPFTRSGKGIDKIQLRSVLDYFGGAGPSVLSGILGQQGTPNRGSYKYKDLTFYAKQIAWSDLVTDEDIIYGEMLAGDVLQIAQANLIPAWKQIEECWLLNSCQQLYTPPTPLVAAVAAGNGGSIAAGSYWVKVTAYNTVSGPSTAGETLATAPVKVTVVLNGAISITLFQLPQGLGVTGYNIYIGADNAGNPPADTAFWKQIAANYQGGATPLQVNTLRQGNQAVQINSLSTSGTAYSTVTTANTAGTNLPYVAQDTNTNSLNLPLTFDGVLAQIILNSGAVGSYGNQALTPLVRQPADKVAGLMVANDINGLLEDMFYNAHADPEDLWCSVKDQEYLTRLIAAASNTRIILNPEGGDAQGDLTVGYRAAKYLNPITSRLIQIRPAPYLQQGTLIFGSMNLPQPAVGIDGPPVRVGVNRELYSRVYLPDQAHQAQTTVTAFANESYINQMIGHYAVLQGVTGS